MIAATIWGSLKTESPEGNSRPGVAPAAAFSNRLTHWLTQLGDRESWVPASDTGAGNSRRAIGLFRHSPKGAMTW